MPNQNETMSSKETAKFLGLSTGRLTEKAKRGLIPGCKVGRDWRFLKADLVQWMRDQYDVNRKSAQVDIIGDNLCQFTKRKEVLTTIRASQNAESELIDLLTASRRQRHKSMKINSYTK